MASFKDISAAKPAVTTTVAQAVEPTVAGIHPRDDVKTDFTHDTSSHDGSTPPESIIDEKNPFSDPNVAKYYKELYENANYECRDAFDPELEWTPAEEKRLVRKLDVRVCAFACFAFFALQVDRGNLAQAVSDNLLNDLGLTTDDYNTGTPHNTRHGINLANSCRQYYLSSFIPAGRDSKPVDFEEAWPG